MMTKQVPEKSRNVHQLQNETLQGLLPADWQVILDTHDEYMRRGSLVRIFPVRETVQNYSKYFDTMRYGNVILQKWLLAGEGKVFTKEAKAPNKAPDWVCKQIDFDEA